MGMLISKRRKAQRKKAAEGKGKEAPKVEEAADIVTDEGVFVDVTEESLIEDSEEVIADQQPKKKGKK